MLKTDYPDECPVFHVRAAGILSGLTRLYQNDVLVGTMTPPIHLIFGQLPVERVEDGYSGEVSLWNLMPRTPAARDMLAVAKQVRWEYQNDSDEGQLRRIHEALSNG